MLQPLIDLLEKCFNFFVFLYVCPQFENAVLLRLGNYKKTLTSKNGVFNTGLHFIFPFYIDIVYSKSVVEDTHQLKSQALTSKDGVSVTVEVILKFRVFDVAAFLLKIDGQVSAFSDIAAGTIGAIVSQNNWEYLFKNQYGEVKELYVDILNELMLQYGIKVHSVAFRTFQNCRTIKLINDSYLMEGRSGNI